MQQKLTAAYVPALVLSTLLLPEDTLKNPRIK